MFKKIFRTLAVIILPPIAHLFIRLIYATNKKVFHGPASVGPEPFIIAAWHGNLLLLPYAYKRYRTTTKVKILISEHFDGNLISKTFSYFGYVSIRGSSTRGGAKALIESIKALRDGYDMGLTPDGPKGPRNEVHDGIVAMAQKTNTKILLVTIKPTKYWQLSSWDKFVIPKPFGTINFYLSELLDVSGVEPTEANALIQKGLMEHE